MFAAFEAHVINVTATIENALSVPVKFLDFGTVFPQEYLVKPVDVSLSASFLAEPGVDSVSYFVRQKPKCAITSEGGTLYDNTVIDGAHAYTRTGHVSVTLGDDPATTSTVETDFPITSIDCGPAPRELIAGETWEVLPSLCPYLSKHKETDEGQGELESQIDAFHQPYTTSVGTTTVTYTDAKGYLQQQTDVTDQWQIDLAVPCFGNYCAQDWASFVASKNPTQNTQELANSWTQPISNEHKVFGCDLWLEVSGVGRDEVVEQPQLQQE